MSNFQKLQYRIKELVDRIFAILLLLVLLPLILIIAILIKFDSKGPVIFKQERLGKNGNVFLIHKFRTMCDNAENMGDGIFTSKNDNRITRIGNILRRTSLDEVPQLINVLKGEMSFIGPRPPLVHHPYHYESYDNEQVKRFKILPGITGYAQAYGRNSVAWPERIKMDVQYYDNFSLLLDFKIIIATFLAIVSSKGTYSDRNNKEKEIK